MNDYDVDGNSTANDVDDSYENDDNFEENDDIDHIDIDNIDDMEFDDDDENEDQYQYEDDVPNDLNKWTKNSSAIQKIVKQMLLNKDDNNQGIPLYVLPLRESKNNATTHYFHLKGFRLNDITPKRVIDIYKDKVVFEEKLCWDGLWEIKLKRNKYNYRKNKFYSEIYTINQDVSDGNIFEYIKPYDLDNDTLSIIIKHPTKAKPKLMSMYLFFNVFIPIINRSEYVYH